MKPLILLALVSTLAFAQAPTKKHVAPKKPAAAAAKKAPAVPAKLLKPALWNKVAPAEYQAKFTTTKGDFVVDVHRDWAPLGADRFYNLVRSGYFTDVSFYRVVPGFIVQFGASPSPKVEAAWSKAAIKDEPVKQSNKPYYITFAMGGPNSRTTELFINLRDNAQLDAAGFAPIGEVVQGKEIVDQIFSGYGEIEEQGGHGPSQARLQNEGKPYLDKSFPQLDSIKSASIISGEAPEAPAAKPAVKKRAVPAQKKPATK